MQRFFLLFAVCFAHKYDPKITEASVEKDISLLKQRKFQRSEDFDKSIIAKIEKADRKHVNRTVNRCRVFSDQITKDFHIWSTNGGISRSDFEEGKKSPRVNHYQIRGKKLYRNTQSMIKCYKNIY